MTSLTKKWFLLITLLSVTFSMVAQEIDLMLKGGTVIDPKNKLNKQLDIAIDDGIIVQIGPNLPTNNVFQVVDVTGLYVVPGIIDMHGHHFYGTESDAYLSNGSSALAPDGYTFRSGVTTVVDVGGSGWRNFKIFKKQTIETSQTRVLSFLNIIGTGMKGGPVEQNLLDMDARLTAMEALAFPEFIVGVKVAHYAGPEWTPVDQAVQAGKLANIPVMIDFGGVEPELSLEILFNEKLRPGDIFTHCYAKVKGRIPLVDEKRKLKPFVLPAQKRGIIFDVGHGGGSFLWDQAIPAIEQGFKPNTISTDLHTGSMNGGMKDQLNVMSKLLNAGLSLEEVIEASTWKPAQVINRPALGHLTVGSGADIAVLKMENGSFGYTDILGWKIIGNKKLVCELTLRDGKAVWDLNGISKPLWEK